jgi:hypothetical protein
MGLTGIPNTAISGTATAQAGLSVNINFYLLLDNSPSMNIAATSDVIQKMVNNTAAQGGCAFACHETNPSADNLGNPGGVDNYQLAKNLGVVTRMQNLASATQSLMTTATATEGANTSQYQMVIYTFRQQRAQHHSVADFESDGRAAGGGQYQRAAGLQEQLAHQHQQQQRHGYQFRNGDVADQCDHARSGPGHADLDAAGSAVHRLRRRRRRGQQLDLLEGAERQPLPAAVQHDVVHVDQESRYPDRGALHRLPAAADQLLVQ